MLNAICLKTQKSRLITTTPTQLHSQNSESNSAMTQLLHVRNIMHEKPGPRGHAVINVITTYLQAHKAAGCEPGRCHGCAGKAAYLRHEKGRDCMCQLLLAGIGTDISQLVESSVSLQCTCVQLIEVEPLSINTSRISAYQRG